MIKLTLPYPISANCYWATRAWVDKRTHKAMAVTYVTEEAKAFKSEVGWIAKAAGCRTPSTRPIALEVTLIPKNGVCMDLDNALKVTIDALKGVVYEDDSQVREIIARRAEADPRGAKTLVTVTEFVPAALPLFAEAAA